MIAFIRLTSITALLGTCFLSTGAQPRGELSRADIAKLGKPATVLVETAKGRKAQGSAFCIHADGFFLTNEHVVRGGTEVFLILHAGQRDQKIISGKVLRIDKDLDLALVKAAPQKDQAVLALGSDDKLSELSEVIALGFPFGDLLAAEKNEYPAVSVNVGSVTSLRMKNRELNRIQLDAVLNPGNSGGPILDREGKVVGVVQSGVPGAGVNFAIPVSHVLKFISRPEMVFYPPRVKPAARHEPVTFEAHARSLLSPKNELEVELILSGADLPERILKMKGQDGVYSVIAPVVPSPNGPQSIKLAAIFPGGSVNGTVADQPVTVGSRDLRLAEIRRILEQPEPRVILHDGKVVKGACTKVDALPVQLGNVTVTLDLRKAVDARLELPGTVGLVHCNVVARLAGKELGRVTGYISLGGTAAMTDDFIETDLEPPQLGKDEVMVALPSLAQDLTVGGAGRFLIFHLPKLTKLAILDVNQAKIIKTLPMTANDLKFAAGMDKLVVAFPGTRTLERWNLRNFEKEVSVPYPFKGEVAELAMGAGSRGPLIVLVKTEIRPNSYETRFNLFELDKFEPVEFAWGPKGVYEVHGDRMHLRASMAGKSAGVWCTSQSPSGVGVIQWKDKTAYRAYQHAAAGHVVPGPGDKIFTGMGMYNFQDSELKPTFLDSAQIDRYIPANQGGYYLNLGPSPGGLKTNKNPTIYRLGVETPILEVPQIEVPTQREEFLKSGFTFDKRIHFLPHANLIISIPLSNDRLMLYRVDVEAAAKKK